MSRLGRTFRTLSYLRPTQIAVRAERRLVRPRFDLAAPPGLRRRAGSLVPPIEQADGWIAPGRVRLLNLECEFQGPINWAPDGFPRLWVYHLHYFRDLPQAAFGDRTHLPDVVRAWLDANPPGTPNAWDPYPTSIRILNWTMWLLLGGLGPSGGGEVVATARLAERVLGSLAIQARHVARRLERDLMANHLLANAAALAAAGLFFGDREGDGWLALGLRLLREEIDEQILPDGGHFERSPMYHALVLEQLLEVLNVWRAFPDAAPPPGGADRRTLEDTARRMLAWLGAVVHPDGDLAFFNDSTLGVAPPLGELSAFASRLGIEPEPAPAGPVVALPDSGYFRLTSADGRTILIGDAGEVGPDYQPGHGHCDALSFELSRDGHRVFVNSGISTYEPGEARLQQRGTAAHNTVRIDGEDQCEIWGSHRCGRRARILSVDLRDDGTSPHLGAGHTGFEHLSGRPWHRRGITVGRDSVVVEDEFGEAGPPGRERLVEWFLHFHPDVDLFHEGGEFLIARDGAAVCALVLPDDLRVATERDAWHPGFNLSVPSTRLIASWSGAFPATFSITIEWRS
jgi:uncharacterized heparinase superfamily protein